MTSTPRGRAETVTRSGTARLPAVSQLALASAGLVCDKREVSEHSRYRLEDGMPCVDIRITRLEQMFDNRDPAPFRERDLDPDLVEYLLAVGEDLAEHDGFRIVFWLENRAQPGE